MSAQEKIGRNDPCHCGSGKKFKQCCLGKKNEVAEKARLGLSIVIAILGFAGGGVLWFVKGPSFGLAAAAAGIIVAAAAYVFRDPDPPRGSSGSDSSAINFGK